MYAFSNKNSLVWTRPELPVLISAGKRMKIKLGKSKSYDGSLKAFHSQHLFNFCWHSVEYMTKGLHFMICTIITIFFLKVYWSEFSEVSVTQTEHIAKSSCDKLSLTKKCVDIMKKLHESCIKNHKDSTLQKGQGYNLSLLPCTCWNADT